MYLRNIDIIKYFQYINSNNSLVGFHFLTFRIREEIFIKDTSTFKSVFKYHKFSMTYIRILSDQRFSIT